MASSAGKGAGSGMAAGRYSSSGPYTHGAGRIAGGARRSMQPHPCPP